MKEEILSIASDLREGSMTTNEAHAQLLLLLSGVGRITSFVCGHPPNKTFLLNGIWYCDECDGKWESLANK